MNSGDKLFCYTDGIFENRGKSNELVTEQGILDALKADYSLVVNNNSIQKSMKNAWANGPIEDDTTYILFQWKKN